MSAWGKHDCPHGTEPKAKDAHGLEARFLARSMLSSSSIGSGSGRNASPSVRRTILASSQSDQLSMYQRSSSKRSAQEIESRPCTCAQPVLPFPVAGSLLDNVRPRADEAHPAGDHVDELGQLVEARPPEPAADAGDARVVLDDPEGVLRQPLLLADADGVGDHRPELQHPERPSALSRAVRDEEDRSAGVDHDRDHDGRVDGAEHDEPEGRGYRVEDALHHPLHGASIHPRAPASLRLRT